MLVKGTNGIHKGIGRYDTDYAKASSDVVLI